MEDLDDFFLKSEPDRDEDNKTKMNAADKVLNQIFGFGT